MMSSSSNISIDYNSLLVRTEKARESLKYDTKKNYTSLNDFKSASDKDKAL